MLEKLRAEKQRKLLEKDLPTAMHQAAILSTYLPLDEVLRSLSEGSSVLAQEFRKVCAAIQKGAEPETALRHAAAQSSSLLFEKATDILLLGYSTGANISPSLINIGDEIAERLRIQQDRSVALTVQRYTLLIAAGFIVPVILGAVSAFSQHLQFSAALGLAGGNSALVSSAVAGTKIYSIICAVLSSFFVTYLENKKWFFAAIYAAVLLPASLVLYNVAASLF